MMRVRVAARGAARWQRGHPWIYRSDVVDAPDQPGVASVTNRRGVFLGQALYSPRSEIRLRLIESSARPLDASWWRERLEDCLVRRAGLAGNAHRLVHGEGDGLPSLIVDRYDRWLVVQFLSAGLETMRPTILETLGRLCRPAGILLRHDVAVRRQEGLSQGVELASGEVPEWIEVEEAGVRYLAAPWTGQKTGAFLDQRPNRERAGQLMPNGGEALDCFTYHGSFAMHLARRAGAVTALDASAAALARGAANADLNGYRHISWVEADAFEQLRAFDRAGRRFDLIVVDPPAFAKSRHAVPGALRGYKEINLRALRLLRPDGILVTASCSYHVSRAAFLTMLGDAAADSGRRVTLSQLLGQGVDHPEILTIPETGYLKGAILRVD